jgi:SAM-dependent methyltransferase
VVQASIFELPFAPGSFDFVYCIGVIQHTPAPLSALAAVARMPRLGGRLAVWIYERRWYSFLGLYAWKYGLRTVTRHLSFRENYFFSLFLTAAFWPIWYPLLFAGPVGKALLLALPVPARPYVGKGYGRRDVFRCVAMDALDMYSPAYDLPQRYEDVIEVLRRCGYDDARRTCSGLGIEAGRAGEGSE